ncbi:MAG: RNA polymerase factor sigma-54 [Verrucomicrobiota bacterium]
MSGPGLQQSQSLGLQQQQTIAPQMQQSLLILQAPTLELRQLIQQELSANPTLEDLTEEISLEETTQDPEEDDFDEEFAALSQLDDEWRDYMSQSRSVSARSAEDEEKRQFLLDSLVDPVTLQEHLLEQLGTSDLDEENRKIGELLIGNIDDAGFLQVSLEDLCFSSGIPLPALEKVKNIINSFHPVGVGSENLAECLAIQLDRLDKAHSLESRIVTGHLDDLAKKRYPLIARKLGVSTQQVSRAADFISTLEPKPGRIFSSDVSRYITPDVAIESDGEGGFRINLNNEQVPHLRISNTYKDLMARPGNKGDVKNYIRDKIRNGKFLIRSIHQRQDTIRRISEQIAERQREFLDGGPACLKPMNMAQIADAIGVHETTVSRAIAGKYIATPHGVFEMKYFFTPGYKTESGESMSNTSVKGTLAEIVKNEDPTKPYSDQKLVALLKNKGINIARRTVAKYRDELNILPSNMRKSY